MTTEKGAGIEAFTFLEDTGSYTPDNAYIARIPGDISSKEQLLNVLYEKLDLPGYFGFNWNALYDCLRDFAWINHERIVMIHEQLPALAGDDQKTYVEVLADSVIDWKPGEEHKLEVVFPRTAKNSIETLLRNS